MTFLEATALKDEIINEFYIDPVELIKMGCGGVNITDTALFELLEYTNITKELNPDIQEKSFFVKLLKNIISEKKNYGKE